MGERMFHQWDRECAKTRRRKGGVRLKSGQEKNTRERGVFLRREGGGGGGGGSFLLSKKKREVVRGPVTNSG